MGKCTLTFNDIMYCLAYMNLISVEKHCVNSTTLPQVQLKAATIMAAKNRGERVPMEQPQQ